MFEFGDYRKSRFYLESRQEGIEEGRAKARAERLQKILQEIVGRLSCRGYDAEQLSDMLAIDVEVVKEMLQTHLSLTANQTYS